MNVSEEMEAASEFIEPFSNVCQWVVSLVCGSYSSVSTQAEAERQLLLAGENVLHSINGAIKSYLSE